jgi:chromosome segregation ATPase
MARNNGRHTDTGGQPRVADTGDTQVLPEEPARVTLRASIAADFQARRREHMAEARGATDRVTHHAGEVRKAQGALVNLSAERREKVAELQRLDAEMAELEQAAQDHGTEAEDFRVKARVAGADAEELARVLRDYGIEPDPEPEPEPQRQGDPSGATTTDPWTPEARGFAPPPPYPHNGQLGAAPVFPGGQ